MKHAVLRRSTREGAPTGEYIGELLGAREYTSLTTKRDYIVIDIGVVDEYGKKYKNVEHYFPIDCEDDLLDQFLDILEIDNVTVNDLKTKFKGEQFGIRIKVNVTDRKTFRNVICFWELDDENEEEEDFEEEEVYDENEEEEELEEEEFDDEEESEDEEKSEFDEFDNPNWDAVRNRSSNKRKNSNKKKRGGV